MAGRVPPQPSSGFLLPCKRPSARAEKGVPLRPRIRLYAGACRRRQRRAALADVIIVCYAAHDRIGLVLKPCGKARIWPLW